jgi:hypothetical protein
MGMCCWASEKARDTKCGAGPLCPAMAGTARGEAPPRGLAQVAETVPSVRFRCGARGAGQGRPALRRRSSHRHCCLETHRYGPAGHRPARRHGRHSLFAPVSRSLARASLTPGDADLPWQALTGPVADRRRESWNDRSHCYATLQTMCWWAGRVLNPPYVSSGRVRSVQDPRPKTQDPRPKTQDPRPKTQDPRPKTQDPVMPPGSGVRF